MGKTKEYLLDTLGRLRGATERELAVAMFHYKAGEAWVMTTGTFTRGARELKATIGVRLVDGDELLDWLGDLRD